jgi:hypothetical protein
MARPRAPGKLEKVTLNLWQGDFTKVGIVCHDDSGTVIRGWVRSMLKERIAELKSNMRLSKVGGDNA